MKEYGKKINNCVRKKEKVLLIHRYYWPDTAPYGHILRKIGIYLSKIYSIDVISTQPSYGAKYKNYHLFNKFCFEDGLRVNRVHLFEQTKNNIIKFINIVLFTLNVFFKIIVRPKYKFIIVSTSPPIILSFMVALASRIKRSDLIYHCMDLYPEIGSISGDFKNKFLFKTLEKLELFTCLVAKKIILLSKDMEKSLLLRSNLLKNKIHIINNFAISDFYSNSISAGSEVKIIFAGNFGRFQALDQFIRVFIKYSFNLNIKLIFVGDGSRINHIKKLAEGNNNIKFYKHQSFENLKKLINQSDFGLISLEKNISSYAFPSKFMTYISAGIKIILFSKNNSEITELIINHRLGEVLNENNENDYKKIFLNISNSKLNIKEKKRINRFYKDNFSEKIFFHKFDSIHDL